MILILLLLIPFVAADQPLAQLCRASASHMNDSTYYANLELLSTLLSKSISSTQALLSKGFAGTAVDHLYGIATCRGDSQALPCQSCITKAFDDVRQLCRPRDEMHILYEYCIVHITTTDLTIYDSNAVLDRLLVFMDTAQDNRDPSVPIEARAKYTDVGIDENIKLLLKETAKQAAYNSTTRYATGRMDLNSTFPLLYSLTQCNLDLPPNDCWDCLDNITSEPNNFFYRQTSEWIAGVWCSFMFNTYQFYQGQIMQHVAWPDTTNMTAPVPAQGPVGVPLRRKDKNKQKNKSKTICSDFSQN